MLRATCQRRGILPSPLLELILVSSASIQRVRSYHTRPPASSDVKPQVPDTLALMSALETMLSKHKRGLTDLEAESHNSRLSSFRLALGTNDPVHIRDAFEDLMAHSSIEVLMARDLEMISRMLHNHFITSRDIKGTMAGARAMAIKVAAKGQLDGLRACLLLHLRFGDIMGVISTYDEFIKPINYHLTPLSEQKQEPLSDDTLPAISMSKPTLPRDLTPHVTDLILTVVAACATQNRFDYAFDRFMAIPETIRVPGPRAKAFCDAHLTHDPALSKKVQVWTQELVDLRLLSQPQSLQNYVTSLANGKQIISLRRLYSSAISHFETLDGNNLVASRGDLEASRRRIILSSAVWDIFMQAFFTCNRADLVEELWNNVTGLGVSPNHHMWTTRLVGYARSGQCDKAMSLWNGMLEADIQPKEHDYGAMIQVYFSKRRPREGYALFEQYRLRSEKTAEGKRLLHDQTMLPLFNIVLHGLCLNGWDKQAKTLMKDMTDQGPKPDIISYNTFLRHYGRIGDMKSVASVLRALKPANIQPDIHSYTTLLSALYRGGIRDAHKRMIQIMETMGVQPNVAMYSTIIDFLVRQGGLDNFRDAAMLLQLMENNPDKESRPNEITYTGFLAGLHRDPTMSVQDVKSYTESLFVQMHKNGSPPNRTTYHYLIKASLENPEAQGLQTALGYYREMGKRGITLTDRTWYVILSSLLRRGDWAIAGEVISDMIKQGHAPDGALATLIQKVQREIASNRGFA